MASRVDILQGTLDMLILKALSMGPKHGYGVLLRIQQMSGETLQIPQGSLYPALYRLESKKYIKSKWGESENNRRSRYYELTAAGRKQLESETLYWGRLSDAIGTVLNAEEAEDV
jgi:transcriptional regulator